MTPFQAKGLNKPKEFLNINLYPAKKERQKATFNRQIKMSQQSLKKVFEQQKRTLSTISSIFAAKKVKVVHFAATIKKNISYNTT